MNQISNNLFIEQKNNICVIRFNNLENVEDLFSKKTIQEIENLCKDQNIILLLFILENKKDVPINNQLSENLIEQKESLKNFFYKMTIPSVVLIDGICKDFYLEFALLCDMRLCSSSSKIVFPEYKSNNFIDERLFTLCGQRKFEIIKKYFGKDASITELSETNFINLILNSENYLNEALEFCNKLIINRTRLRVETITKCLNAYKDYYNYSNDIIMMEEEVKQFCWLVYKDFHKNSNQDGEVLNG